MQSQRSSINEVKELCKDFQASQAYLRASRETKDLLRALINDRLGERHFNQNTLRQDLYECVCKWFFEVTDNVEGNDKVNKCIEQLTLCGSANAYHTVVSTIFENGEINLGRVLAFFSFAYELCVKFPDDTEGIMGIMDNLVDEFIIKWIVDMGGWESLVQSYKINRFDYVSKTKLACCIAALAIGGFIMFKIAV